MEHILETAQAQLKHTVIYVTLVSMGVEAVRVHRLCLPICITRGPIPSVVFSLYQKHSPLLTPALLDWNRRASFLMPDKRGGASMKAVAETRRVSRRRTRRWRRLDEVRTI